MDQYQFPKKIEILKFFRINYDSIFSEIDATKPKVDSKVLIVQCAVTTGVTKNFDWVGPNWKHYFGDHFR